MYGPGVSSRASQGGTYQRLKITDAPPHPDLPWTTWGGWILTLHLIYVAGYTNFLLFLFERTQQLMPLKTRGKPSRLRVTAGPKFVRPHR